MAANQVKRPRGPCSPQDPDADAVARALAGDESGYAQLKGKYFGPMKEVAYKALGNATLARDTVEAAFTDAFTNLGKFRGESSFFTWFFKVTRSRIAKGLRQLKKHKHDISINDAPPDPIDEDGEPVAESVAAPRETEPVFRYEQRQRCEALYGLVDRLTPKLREVFRMLLDGLAVGEIAEKLGCSPGTVRMHISRGREKLREMEKEGKRD